MQTAFVVFHKFGFDGAGYPAALYASAEALLKTFPQARKWEDVTLDFNGVVYRELEIFDNVA